MRIGVIGTSIWQQNMPLLEKLTIDRECRSTILSDLKTRLEIDELIYLATCNRVEFIYATSGRDSDSRLLHRLIDFFFSSGRNINFAPNDLFHHREKDAVLHIFRTCSSLDSLVIGENQITGQFKNASQEALEEGLAGKNLDHLAREALATARKVKSQTSIGNGSVSMASLAFGEMQKEFNKEAWPQIALVGSGKMPEKMARYCRESFDCDLTFINRTPEKAFDLAERFGGKAVVLDDFIENPHEADAVVSATASPEPIFNCAFRNRLLVKNSRVVCVDLAVPRDFCAEFGDDNRIVMIDIPMLREKSDGSLRHKFMQAEKANEIVRAAADKFLSNRIEISLKPIFRDCYDESMELARNKLEELFSDRLASLGSKEKQEVMQIITKLIGHSTFSPVKRISMQLIDEKPGSRPEDPPMMQGESA